MSQPSLDQFQADCAFIGKRLDETAALRRRIARLEADLNECREYLETEMDVVDGGEFGEGAPNRAMSLVSMIDESLNGPGNF